MLSRFSVKESRVAEVARGPQSANLEQAKPCRKGDARIQPCKATPNQTDVAHRRTAECRRRGIDRLACAWIIQRFIDAEPRFAFVRPGETPPPEATTFDMPGVEFGHHGSRCSAETLAAHFRPQDPALQAVAEVVHDLDLKDEGFGRLEAAGLKRLLDGICTVTQDDGERIRSAIPLFDALYAGFCQ